MKKSLSSFKQGSVEYTWNPKVLKDVQVVAEKLKKSELFIFWLNEVSRRSEKYFDTWLVDLARFSKQELIDVIHEIGPEAGGRFLKQYGKSAT